MNNRVDWVDVSKGIGIILVVLGHIYLAEQGHKYIYSFHMPLFFFLSGYTFNLEKYRNLRQLSAAKLKSILIPYFWFSVFSYAYWVLVERRISHNPVNPDLAFVNIFISQGSNSYLPHNPALWFLTCLFIVVVLFYMIARNRNRLNIALLMIISSILGYMTSLYLPVNLPWSAEVALTGTVFYGVGFLARDIKSINTIPNHMLFIFLCLCLAIGIIISDINKDVSMAENHFGNYFYFYIGAFFGIISVLIVSKLLCSCRLLIYIGRNSLIIMGLHFPVKRMVAGLTCKGLDIPLEQLKESFLISSIDTVITILVLLPFIYLINHYFTFVLGTRRKKT